MLDGLKSPWRKPGSPPTLDTTLPPLHPQVSHPSSAKVYECCWDFAVHGTLLSLMNIVTFVGINFFKSKPLPLKRGVLQATIMTCTHLASIEGWNYRYGKNMRKLGFFSPYHGRALLSTIILTPLLTYGYEHLLMHRKVSFVSTVGLAFWNGLGLLAVPCI